MPSPTSCQRQAASRAADSLPAQGAPAVRSCRAARSHQRVEAGPCAGRGVLHTTSSLCPAHCNAGCSWPCSLSLAAPPTAVPFRRPPHGHDRAAAAHAFPVLKRGYGGPEPFGTGPGVLQVGGVQHRPFPADHWRCRLRSIQCPTVTPQSTVAACEVAAKEQRVYHCICGPRRQRRRRAWQPEAPTLW